MSSAGPPSATVLVVDDHPIVRRGLTAMLGLESWVEAASVREGAVVGATEAADVAVVDLGLPTATGSSWSAASGAPPAARCSCSR
jgi:two-component system nitrate/nitrite response regulator NarL